MARAFENYIKRAVHRGVTAGPEGIRGEQRQCKLTDREIATKTRACGCFGPEAKRTVHCLPKVTEQ